MAPTDRKLNMHEDSFNMDNHQKKSPSAVTLKRQNTPPCLNHGSLSTGEKREGKEKREIKGRERKCIK